MKSHEADDHGVAGQNSREAKKPWMTPSLQFIALESAEGGTHLSTSDGVGGHAARRRS